MKNLLKIALLLCVVSGQALGAEANLSDGGASSTQVEGVDTKKRRSFEIAPNRRAKETAQHLTLNKIFTETLRRQGEMSLPLLHVELDRQYTIDLESHYKEDPTYRSTILQRLNNCTVRYQTFKTEVGELGQRVSLDLRQLEEPIIARAKTEAQRLNTENQQLKTEAAKRWSGKTHFALGVATASLGYLAYKNRDSLNASCKNWFNKRFAPLAKQTT